MKSKLMRTKSQRIVLLCILPFLAAGALLLAKALYARYVMPHMPPCMLRTLTGWRCPSCGLTHAVFALCRGDVIGSVRENPILMFGVVIGALWYLERWTDVLRKPKKLIPRRSGFWVGVLIALAVYTVLRNVI